MMTREGWYLPSFEQQAVDRATTAGESYEPKVYWSLRCETSIFLAIVRAGIGSRPWRLSVKGKRVLGSHANPETAALWAERTYLGGRSPTGERLEEFVPEEEAPSPLRIPLGVTVFARPEHDSLYLWRDESVGEEPEEGAQRECAPDVYEALSCAVDYPTLRQVSALERAATALQAVGHLTRAPIAAEAEALYQTLPAEARARIEAADKALRERKLSAEEKALLRLAWFWE